MHDADVIFDVDIAGVDTIGPWVECEWGHSGCTRADYAEWMFVHDGGWMCPNCRDVNNAEAEEYMWCARYA